MAGFDGLDEACFCCEALHLGLPKNLCSEAFQFVFDGGDESFGRKVAIFGEEDAACDIHGDGWIEGSGGFGIEHVCGNAESVGACGHVGFLIEGLLFFAEHEQAFFDEAEVETDLFEALTAEEAQVAEDGGGAIDFFLRGGLPEAQAPGDEVEIESGFDVEGRFGIPHPFEAEFDHAWGRQGNEVAGDDHACIAEGAAVALGEISFDQGDLHATPGAVEGCAESDDTGTDDGDGFHGGRRMGIFNGWRGFGRLSWMV